MQKRCTRGFIFTPLHSEPCRLHLQFQQLKKIFVKLIDLKVENTSQESRYASEIARLGFAPAALMELLLLYTSINKSKIRSSIWKIRMKFYSLPLLITPGLLNTLEV